MPEFVFGSIKRSVGQSVFRVCAPGDKQQLLAVLGSLLLAGSVSAAETSYVAGAGLNYKFDDNITISPLDQISLAGWILDGFFNGKYATSRFKASADLKLDFERYNRASLDSDNPDLIDPEPEDFNSDNQDLKGDIAYKWERQTLSLYGRYWRDSTLNTQFTDTGLAQGREIEGATRRISSTLKPSWNWQITEKQTLDTSIEGQTVDFQSDLYVDYDFATVNVSWTTILTERMSFQLVPYYSWFKNEADISVRSNTYGVQAGYLWALTEKWQWNLLAGGSKVYTEYGQGGFVIVDPDTGEIEFVEDQDSSSFIGNTTLAFNEERYGFNANISSQVTPSGDGILRQQNQGRLLFYWKPLERMRFDIDGLVGRSTSTDDRIDDGRDYRQAGARFAYQFLSEWWISARYRFRETEYDRSTVGAGRGNSVFVTLSYRLPEEIF